MKKNYSTFEIEKKNEKNKKMNLFSSTVHNNAYLNYFFDSDEVTCKGKVAVTKYLNFSGK